MSPAAATISTAAPSSISSSSSSLHSATPVSGAPTSPSSPGRLGVGGGGGGGGTDLGVPALPYRPYGGPESFSSSSSKGKGNIAGGGGGDGAEGDPLVALRDDRSSYASVARSVLAARRSLFGPAPGGAQEEGTGTDGARAIFALVPTPPLHDATFATRASSTLMALMECARSHADRRCRLLSLKAVAATARQCYAALRRSDLLFSTRDGLTTIVGRVEDECANDVPVCLLETALDDDDEGVASTAIEALGLLTLDACDDTDAVLIEMHSLIANGPCSDSPAVRSIDLDDNGPAVAMSELQRRVWDGTLPPRLRRLLQRVSLFRSTSHVVKCLPMLTAAVVRRIETAPGPNGSNSSAPVPGMGLDRASHGKRGWATADAVDVANDLIEGVVLPLLHGDRWDVDCDGNSSSSYAAAADLGGVRRAAALSSLRLVHACPRATWVDRTIRSAASILLDECRRCCCSSTATAMAVPMEVRCGSVAALLIALRGVPVEERAGGIAAVLSAIRKLPCTAAMPYDVTSVGWFVDPELDCDGNEEGQSEKGAKKGKRETIGRRWRKSARRLVRTGFMTEAALLLLLPDGGGGTIAGDGRGGEVEGGVRSKALRRVLTGEAAVSILRLAERKGGGTTTRAGAGIACPAEELVLAFCSVASLVGQRLLDAVAEPSSIEKGRPEDEAEEWLRCALVLLKELMLCLGWRCGGSAAIASSSENVYNNGGEQRSGESGGSSAGTGDEVASLASFLTIRAAARDSYVHLLRQCLRCAGFLSSSSSVALRLMPLAATYHPGAHAAPPPSLMGIVEPTLEAESAPLVGCVFARDGLSNLADDLVKQKLRECEVPSRHVRIGLLALLSDHWAQQCCYAMTNASSAAFRKDGDDDGADMHETNAREILSMLATEITTLMNDDVGTTPVSIDDEGREETSSTDRSIEEDEVMGHHLVCVGCVETIALTAWEWDRMFGERENDVAERDRSPRRKTDTSRDVDEDSSYIVSVSMAILRGQGQMKDASSDGERAGKRNVKMRLAMASECNAAAKRVEGVISSRGASQGGFLKHFNNPESPLVRNASLIVQNRFDRWMMFSFGDSEGDSSAREEYHCLYLFHLVRQVIVCHTEHAIQSLLHDGASHSATAGTRADSRAEGPISERIISVPARPRETLRIPSPLASTSRSYFSCRLPEAKQKWANSVTTLTGASDPVVLTMAHFIRRCLRSDGEVERKLIVSLRMYNITAVPILHGVRLDLTVTHGDDSGAFLQSTAMSVYKNEIEPGDHITWDVTLNGCSGPACLDASVTFRETETETSIYKWVGTGTTGRGRGASTLSNVDEGDETQDGDFSAEQESSGGGFFNSVEGTFDEEDETMDIHLSGEPVTVSPLVMLRPCPLVFFNAGCGDEASFRFLWFRMPYSIPDLDLIKSRPEERDTGGEAAQFVAELCGVKFSNHNQEVTSSRGWAFILPNGKHVLIVCRWARDDKKSSPRLQIRGDCRRSIFSIAGTVPARKRLILDLTGGDWTSSDGL